jgi:hypothetical protein
VVRKRIQQAKEEVYGNKFDRNLKDVEAISFWQSAVVALGRFFFALIFLFAAPNHFTSPRESSQPLSAGGYPLLLCRKSTSH